MSIEDILSESMEQTREIPAEPLERPEELPPRLERSDAGGIQAPRLERAEGAESAKAGLDVRLGESVEARAAKHALERAIEKGNKTAAEHRAQDLADVLEKEDKKNAEK